MWGLSKKNGYRSYNPNLDLGVKVWLKKLYFKIDLANEKIINNEFRHKLCWGIVAQWKGVNQLVHTQLRHGQGEN